MKSGVGPWIYFIENIEWILPISIAAVLLIYYFDKKNKEKK